MGKHQSVGMNRQKPHCPKCESDNVVPIVFGYPNEELLESAARGEVSLGGCCVAADDPEWRCKDCEHEW